LASREIVVESCVSNTSQSICYSRIKTFEKKESYSYSIQNNKGLIAPIGTSGLLVLRYPFSTVFPQ